MVLIICAIGILIPFLGMVVLISRGQQSESSIRLLLATIGGLLMNSGYMLLVTAKNNDAALTALKIEFWGGAFFYFFFLLFVLSYIKPDIPKIWLFIWGMFECNIVAVVWDDYLCDNWFCKYEFSKSITHKCMRLKISDETKLYMLRYNLLVLILLLGMSYGLYKMFKTKLLSERRNLGIIVGSQFIVVVSLVVQIIANPTIDVVPLLASLSIVMLIISVHKDGFFGVTHWGHEWVFRQMEDAYIIVDSLYGYLDSNESAKELFKELSNINAGDDIPTQLYNIFVGRDDNCKIGDKVYERKVTSINNREKLAGYGMLLHDVTEQQNHMKLIEKYSSQLEVEVEEKTQHIQLVQDSIITGLANVVESRDNSTGGHINRTSTVVKILANKLTENTELGLDSKFLNCVIKVAPMHDLGKVAVDDIVLRKPGKYTEEEYAQMKTHSNEGARVIQKVLAEVDDEMLVNTAINVAHYHHERWDGKGYPEGLAGEEIPIEARIMALADVFDALVSKRCYKEAFSYDKAFSIIEEGLGTQFDPVLGKVFISCREELEKLYSQIE